MALTLEATTSTSIYINYYSTDSSYKSVEYVITYATCGNYEPYIIPEEVNLTDWGGLMRWFVGFSGNPRKVPVGYVIRQPARERGQKRKMRVQKLYL